MLVVHYIQWFEVYWKRLATGCVSVQNEIYLQLATLELIDQPQEVSELSGLSS